MLKGLPPILSPELLKVLCEMRHVILEKSSMMCLIFFRRFYREKDEKVEGKCPLF